MRPLLTAALLAVAVPPAFAQPATLPQPIAIYYGWPSLVNGATSLAAAAAAFQPYARVVLGDGLQDPTHPDHANTLAIVALVPGTAFFGYITLGNTGGNGLPRAEIQRRIGLWQAVGVVGILLDEAGYEYNVSRQRQLDALADVHAAGMVAWVNAWIADDVFSPAVTPLNPNGLPSGLGPTDRYLLESFGEILGQYEPASQTIQRAEAAFGWSAALGTRIDTVTTTVDGLPFDQAKLDYAWWATLLYGFDGMGHGEPIFSAWNLQLPLRARPAPAGVAGTWVSGVTHAPALPVHHRVATAGHVRLDTEAYVGSFAPANLSGPGVAPLGASTAFSLAAPGSSGLPYATLATDATAPGLVWLDGRVLPVNAGPWLTLSLTPNAVFGSFLGTLDGNGNAAPTLHVPALPSLSGLTFAMVGAVLDPAQAELLRVFTTPHWVQLQ